MTFDKIAQGAAATAQGVGGALSILGVGNKRQDERQIRQQGRLQELQIKGNKEMQDYMSEKEYEMWLKTGLVGQMQQAKEAGLSTAYMMGKGGGQAAQMGGSGMAIGGGHAADAAATQSANTQQAMAAAQTANIVANTEKTKAETNKLEGADTENVMLDNEYKKIQNELAKRSLEDNLNIIKDRAKEAYATASIRQGEHGIMENTQQKQIDTINQRFDMLIIEAAAMKQGIKLDEARVAEIAKNIEARFEEIKVSREGQEVSRENMEKLTETMLWSAGINATGNVINSLIDVRKMKMDQMFKGKEADKSREHDSRTIRETVDKYDKNGNYSGGYNKRRR